MEGHHGANGQRRRRYSARLVAAIVPGDVDTLALVVRRSKVLMAETRGVFAAEGVLILDETPDIERLLTAFDLFDFAIIDEDIYDATEKRTLLRADSAFAGRFTGNELALKRRRGRKDRCFCPEPNLVGRCVARIEDHRLTLIAQPQVSVLTNTGTYPNRQVSTQLSLCSFLSFFHAGLSGACSG